VGSEEVTTTPESRRDLTAMIGIAVVASLLGIALGLLIDWFPLAASEEAGPIDTLYDVLIIASVPMFVLVCAVVLYSVRKFRMRPGQELMDGPPIHGNTKLEVIWTVIPAILMFGLSAYAYLVLDDIEDAKGATPMEVRVVGEQFTWTFFYPSEGGDGEGEEVASSQLYLPVDKPVLFQVQSKDVLHDFWVPAFRQKIDAVPGITTNFKVTPNREGNYEIVCAELCGLGHAVMRQTARVVSQDEFDQWLQDERTSADEEDSPTEGGAGEGGGGDGGGVFTAAGCGACHTLADAGTQATVGPNLDDTLEGKDEAYIREGIIDPDATLAEGFEDQGGIMPPNFGTTLDEGEVDALVQYLAEVTK
jgi:cytochrome c oxidase subunit II